MRGQQGRSRPVFPQTPHNALHGIARPGKGRFPGGLPLPGNVPDGVAAGGPRQGVQDHPAVRARPDLCHNILRTGPAAQKAHKAVSGQHTLQLFIHGVALGGAAVAHKAHGGFTAVIGPGDVRQKPRRGAPTRRTENCPAQPAAASAIRR